MDTLIPKLLTISFVERKLLKKESPVWRVKYKCKIKFRENIFEKVVFAVHGIDYDLSFYKRDWTINLDAIKLSECTYMQIEALMIEIHSKIHELLEDELKYLVAFEESISKPIIHSLTFKENSHPQAIEVFFKIENNKNDFKIFIIYDHHEAVWYYTTLEFYVQKFDKYDNYKNVPSLSWKDYLFDQISDVLATEHPKFRIRAALRNNKKNYHYHRFTPIVFSENNK